MNKNEIINTIAEITNLIKTKKKTLKQLTDIHETLTQIAPALDNRELKEEIDLVKFNIDLLIDNLKSYKKKLKLIEQLEAIVIK